MRQRANSFQGLGSFQSDAYLQGGAYAHLVEPGVFSNINGLLAIHAVEDDADARAALFLQVFNTISKHQAAAK